MSKNRELVELKNIGQKIAERLKEAGIHSEDDLRAVGAAAAYKKIKAIYPDETLPVCYYLYSFEGALHDRHWNDIGDDRKRALISKTR